MQTFLPHADFRRSAASLDRQRLGKQRVECLQLLKSQFPNHPCAKMWRGYEDALATYGIEICLEWRRRGYRDTCLLKIANFLSSEPVVMPHWFGSYSLHASHRSMLVQKLPEHYGPQFPFAAVNLAYVWPEPKEIT